MAAKKKYTPMAEQDEYKPPLPDYVEDVEEVPDKPKQLTPMQVVLDELNVVGDGATVLPFRNKVALAVPEDIPSAEKFLEKVKRMAQAMEIAVEVVSIKVGLLKAR